MPHLNPSPRILRSIELPKEVVSALSKVNEAIERGDDETISPSDDCIQIGCLCGGLLDDGSERYYFSVYLDEIRPYSWDIALGHAEIKAIVDCSKTALNLWCCSNPDCGFKTYIEDITCSWCDYGRSREWPPPQIPPLSPEDAAKLEEFRKMTAAIVLPFTQSLIEKFSELRIRKAEEVADPPTTAPS